MDSLYIVRVSYPAINEIRFLTADGLLSKRLIEAHIYKDKREADQAADTMQPNALAIPCSSYGITWPRSDEPPPDPRDLCAHEWSYSGTQYGGDDERWQGEGRVICVKCGADGDA